MKIQIIAEGKTYEGDLSWVTKGFDCGWRTDEKKGSPDVVEVKDGDKVNATTDHIIFTAKAPQAVPTCLEWGRLLRGQKEMLKKLGIQGIYYDYTTFRFGEYVKAIECDLVYVLPSGVARFIGVAYCNPVDKYCEAEGKSRATGRAFKALKASKVLKLGE